MRRTLNAERQFTPATMEEMAATGPGRLGVDPEAVRTTWALHRRFGGAPVAGRRCR